MINRSVECSFNFRTKSLLKRLFDCSALAEVYQVVNIQPNVEGRMAWNEGTMEDAWRVGTWAKTEGDED